LGGERRRGENLKKSAKLAIITLAVNSKISKPNNEFYCMTVSSIRFDAMMGILMDERFSR